jgi:acyl-CoA reductase-like NAD-dependent aldehyde dehydrogenase
MRVADGFEPGAVIGPLIDMKAVEKVDAHSADAVKKAPRLLPAASERCRAAASSSRRS